MRIVGYGSCQFRVGGFIGEEEFHLLRNVTFTPIFPQKNANKYLHELLKVSISINRIA